LQLKKRGSHDFQKKFQLLLQCYCQDVPFIGTITLDKANQLLAEKKICRGWMLGSDGELEFFHIIKSPTHFPKLTILVADSEENLLTTTVMLGMQNNVDLEDLFSK